LIDDDITIKQQNKIVNTVIADGSYDSNKNFQILSFKGIKPAIKRLERILLDVER
jgi:hypothetical protein